MSNLSEWLPKAMEFQGLAPAVPVLAEFRTLFASVNEFVREFMSSDGHDNSHDYYHILRVTSNANQILKKELAANRGQQLDTTVIFLGALLHDIGDRKYLKDGQKANEMVLNALLERGASEELASKVQKLVTNVSFSNEKANPLSFREALAEIPEIAVVQDADRLDAIGAVGIGRCFAFHAARKTYALGPMHTAIEHYEEKLYHLESLMKTVSGKDMAKERTERLHSFARWWEEETALSFRMEEAGMST